MLNQFFSIGMHLRKHSTNGKHGNEVSISNIKGTHGPTHFLCTVSVSGVHHHTSHSHLTLLHLST